METALPLLLFLAFLFGSGLLILISGIHSREQERDEAARPLSSEELLGSPRFFATPASSGPRAAELRAEGLVARVERYLSEQCSFAEEFVDDPSVEGLHDACLAAPPSAETLFRRIEQHLERERAAVARFLSNPSVEYLHRMAPAAA